MTMSSTWLAVVINHICRLVPRETRSILGDLGQTDTTVQAVNAVMMMSEYMLVWTGMMRCHSSPFKPPHQR